MAHFENRRGEGGRQSGFWRQKITPDRNFVIFSYPLDVLYGVYTCARACLCLCRRALVFVSIKRAEKLKSTNVTMMTAIKDGLSNYTRSGPAITCSSCISWKTKFAVAGRPCSASCSFSIHCACPRRPSVDPPAHCSRPPFIYPREN
jgi:hypothetical protein